MLTQTATVNRKNPATFCPGNTFMDGINGKEPNTMRVPKHWIIPSDDSTTLFEPTVISNPIINLIRNIISLMFWPIIKPKCAITATATDDLNNVNLDAPNMYIPASQINKDVSKDSTKPAMSVRQSIARKEIWPIDDKYDVASPGNIVDKGNNGNDGIDTTDFVCTSRIPVVTEFVHITEKSAGCDSNGVQMVMNLQKLPPAVGPCMQVVTENITELIQTSRNMIDVIYNNRCSRRRAARMARKSARKIIFMGKNHNAKYRQELAQFIKKDYEDVYWDETEYCDKDEEMDQSGSVVTTTEVCQPLPEVFESTRPGCIFSHIFSFGQNTTCKNRPWPMDKPKNHHHTKITPIEPKYSIGINEHEYEHELDSIPGDRQLSECSDDFICFEQDSDQSDFSDNESVFEDDDDDDDDEDDDADTDSEIESDCEHISTETNALESGFEEKKVRFNSQPELHKLHVWKYAYAQARKGIWEQAGRDRERFNNRIRDAEPILATILDVNHRKNIFEQRFNN